LSPTEYTFAGPPSLMMATRASGPGLQLSGKHQWRLTAAHWQVLGAGIGAAIRTGGRDHALNVESGVLRARGLRHGRLGRFHRTPPSSEMAIRASSTAISAAKPNDANRGPLPCKRDSHSCVRESSMVLGCLP